MISIVTALDCEARPLIQHFKLQRCQSFKPFPLYTGENIKLAVSGIGKLNALSVTSAMAGIQAGDKLTQHSHISEIAWLNVGIGGHALHEVGSAFLVHKVTDDNDKNKTFYPVWAGKWPCSSTNLMTVSELACDYSHHTIHDMEGSGFCEAASRYSTVELVHLLKIVSDNKAQSVELIDKSMVTKIVEEQIPLIVSVIELLQTTAEELDALSDTPMEYNVLLDRYRVSVSLQYQLKQLLRRWQVLDSTSVLEAVPSDKFHSIKQWMEAAEKQILSLPMSFSK